METVMTLTTFREIYLQELQEARSVERQLTDALARMRDDATAVALKEMLEGHLVDTRAQRDDVEAILKRHEVDPGQHVDQSMSRLIEESHKWVNMLKAGALRDAGLIASIQRIEHYEIAVYGTLASWAKMLGHDDDMKTLLAIRDQEKAADTLLTELAKQSINAEAVD